MHQSPEICPSPATQRAASAVVAPATRAGEGQTYDLALFDLCVQYARNALALREQSRHPRCENPRQAVRDAQWYESEVRSLANWVML